MSLQKVFVEKKKKGLLGHSIARRKEKLGAGRNFVLVKSNPFPSSLAPIEAK